MQLYKHGDPRWALKKLGSSKWNMAQKGCVTTDVTMSADYFGIKMTPGQVVEKLKYTDTGLLLWQSVANIGLKFVWRGYNYNQDTIDEALKNPKRTCLLQVDGGAHWVLGIYRFPLTRKFLVADPFTGTRKIYTGVVGYSILTK